ncbi:MAG: hypothetical protein K6B65_02200 [Bacilli bacterium]|nr:hypothetical protein [Bacilli bacterium]
MKLGTKTLLGFAFLALVGGIGTGLTSFSKPLVETKADNEDTLYLDISVTISNYDSSTMAAPKLEYKAHGVAEYQYFTDLVQDSTDPTLFTGQLSGLTARAEIALHVVVTHNTLGDLSYYYNTEHASGGIWNHWFYVDPLWYSGTLVCSGAVEASDNYATGSYVYTPYARIGFDEDGDGDIDNTRVILTGNYTSSVLYTPTLWQFGKEFSHWSMTDDFQHRAVDPNMVILGDFNLTAVWTDLENTKYIYLVGGLDGESNPVSWANRYIYGNAAEAGHEGYGATPGMAISGFISNTANTTDWREHYSLIGAEFGDGSVPTRHGVVYRIPYYERDGMTKFTLSDRTDAENPVTTCEMPLVENGGYFFDNSAEYPYTQAQITAFGKAMRTVLYFSNIVFGGSVCDLDAEDAAWLYGEYSAAYQALENAGLSTAWLDESPVLTVVSAEYDMENVRLANLAVELNKVANSDSGGVKVADTPTHGYSSFWIIASITVALGVTATVILGIKRKRD